MPRHPPKKASIKLVVSTCSPQSPSPDRSSSGDDGVSGVAMENVSPQIIDSDDDSPLVTSTSKADSDSAGMESESAKVDSDSAEIESEPANAEDSPSAAVNDRVANTVEEALTISIPSDSLTFTPLNEMEVMETYPEQSDLMRERFLKDGPYHQLLVKFMLTKSPSMFLATAKYRLHFSSSTTPREVAFIRENGSLAIFTCFGEIGSPDEGTVLSAKGNHFTGPPGDNFKFLTDESRCKNILVLRRPSLAPPAIHHFFGEQVDLLERVIELTSKTDDEHWKAYKWTRSTSGNKDDPPDGIIVSTPRIYGPPPDEANFRTHKPLAEMEDPTNTQHGTVPRVKSVDVREGAFYDPICLSDYGGPYFKLQRNKLVQQSFYDVHNKLIPPWQTYDKLRTGTLVAVNVSLACFVSPRDKRRFYTIRLRKLRVLAESDEAIHTRYVPGVNVPGQEMERKIELNSEMDDFRVSKRRKVNHEI